MLEQNIPKFRVWDNANKTWATDFTISLDGELLCDGGTTLFVRDNFYIVQWSRFVDKNKKEIFEGDIIKLGGRDTFFVENFNGLYVLRWDQVDQPKEDGFYFRVIHREKLMHEFCAHDFEVIGNVFENEELLEKK